MSYPPSWIPLAIEGLFFVLLAIVIARFRRESSETPLVLTYGDDVNGFSGRVFRANLAATVIVVAIHAVVPDVLAGWAGQIALIDHPVLAWFGIALAFAGALFMVHAQLAMGKSWRIGIPEEQNAPLVDTGVFAISRNPIYLGIMVATLGFLLAIPNAIMLAIAVAGFVGVSYQIRLEEQHLTQAFGRAFEDYRSRVRRWL